MIDGLTWLVVWLNSLADDLGRLLLSPVGAVPGWLSATLIAAVTGVLLLVVFKYTSNQRAIKRVRDGISADLLSIKLFKDNGGVAIRAQGRVLWGALRLFVLGLVPMAVMAGPVMLILGQLSLWYQQRPLRVGEEAVVTLELNANGDSAASEIGLGPSDSPGVAGSPNPATVPTEGLQSSSDVVLRPSDCIVTTVGPVRVPSERQVCWNIQARSPGRHRLVFQLGDQTFTKDLTVGDGFMRVSARRPAWQILDVLEYPAEAPFLPDSPVRSITIDYPSRSSWITGTNVWVIYWFVVSMIAGFCFRRALNVQV